MGAALTYARRYALFTLVGIAGEDDLDAPYLHRDLHRRSDEKAWWEAAKIEPMAIAQRLWRETRDQRG